MVKHKLTVGSLFAGIGGFELGFEATGRFETRWQVECDAYATKVLEKHWPDVQRHDDVCTWPNETTQPVDVIIGGFPCQDISYAGKGAGLDGKRSGLFYELVRIVRVVGPRYIVLENVAALFTRGMDQVLGSLASHGYDAEWEVVSAASVGAPHRRDRVFIIGYAADSDSFGERENVKRHVVQSGATRPAVSHQFMESGNVADAISKQREGCEQKTVSRESRLSQQLRRGCADQREQWAIEPDVGRLANGVPNRVHRLRCLGNAIVPQVAQVVAERLLEIHEANA